MNVLMISTDRKIFDENSAVRRRMIEYGKLVRELHIIVFVKAKDKSQDDLSVIKLKKKNKIKLSNNTWVYPTNSNNRWLYIWDANIIGKKVVGKNSNNFIITTQDPFETGLAGWLVSLTKKIPLHFQVHTDFLSHYFSGESFLNRIRVVIAKFLIPRASGIRVVSGRIKKEIGKKIKILDNKITVLPIFVDIKKIEKAPVKKSLRKKYSQFDFIILMASRFSKEKNIELAIGAMKSIVKDYPMAGLVIVGEGIEKVNYEEKIKNLDLEKNVIIEEWTSDLPSYYKIADLFLLTSNYEGYGLTVIEAMSAGCPVVMSDVGIAGSLLKNGENGIIVPVGNKRAIIEATIQMIRDKNLRERLSLSAQRTARELQTKKEYLQAYKRSWEKCLF